MISTAKAETLGILLSGGLDSCILLGRLLGLGHCLQPIYIRSDLVWQEEEQRGLAHFLESQTSTQLLSLVRLHLPLDDLYQQHWSVTGLRTPDARSSDEAVYLPGRNALLIIKAALWCQLHGIRSLALATLGTSPFADATQPFFDAFEGALNMGSHRKVRILRPFSSSNKQQVMQLGGKFPLERTFSCIAPLNGAHCGNCNKCAERRAAFRSVGRPDLTSYVRPQPQTSSR